MAVEQLSYNGPDGATFGQSSSETISFYGATVTSRSAASANHAITSFVSTAGVYGVATSTQGLLLSDQVSTMAMILRGLGLFT